MKRRKSNEGVALISALATLVLLAVLGTAYVAYMTAEQLESDYEVRKVRARVLAESGIHAATGAIESALRDGALPEGRYTFSIPVYDQGGTAHPHDVEVEVIDESGRVNVNHAPREVLEAIGMERSKVRELKASFPRPDEAASGKRWLVSPAELVSEDYLSGEIYGAHDPELFTVYTAENHFAPERYLNLNSLPAQGLAWVLNMPLDEAEGLLGRRPFSSWEDLLEKSGRDPMAFNVKPDPSLPEAMPADLSFTSRCFRLRSRARVQAAPRSARAPGSVVEAVVLITDGGAIQIRSWREGPWEIERRGTSAAAGGPESTAQNPPDTSTGAKSADSAEAIINGNGGRAGTSSATEE